jgi:type II secretory pathway pseudopilin PulG
MATIDRSQGGMTLLAVMAVMTLVAIALLAAAPSVQHEIQREKEVEAIRRGEEVADAIRKYVEFYRGQRLPNSIDDLLEGLPQGTKKRQILRPSAAVDPLSEDGKWRLIKADPKVLAPFAKRIQDYSNGLLPPNPSPVFDRYAVMILNSANTESAAGSIEDDDDFEVVTDNTPFIGVASQSRSSSVIAYYGIEKHSQWIFTPLFRGTGRSGGPQIAPVPAPQPSM